MASLRDDPFKPRIPGIDVSVPRAMPGGSAIAGMEASEFGGSLRPAVGPVSNPNVGAAGSAEAQAFRATQAAPGAAAAPVAAPPTTVQPPGAATLRERAAVGAGRSVANLARGVGPAAVGAEVVGRMGNYQINDPDVDSSAMGTLRAIGSGDFAGAGRSLSKGAVEAGMDLGSAGANLLDYVVPGKAPVSTAYNGMLRNQLGDQLIDNSGVSGATPAAAAAMPMAAPTSRIPGAPAVQADVRRIDNSLPPPDIRTGNSFSDGGRLPGDVSPGRFGLRADNTGVGMVGAAGVTSADRLAQTNRDIAFQQDKQTWRNPGDPTPGLAVISNGGPNRNQEFNDAASLRTAQARTTTTRRGTTMDPSAEIIASGIRDRQRSRDQAAVNATNRDVAAASDATSRSNNAATVAASKYGADAQLSGSVLKNSFDLQQKAAERAVNAAAWQQSGGDPAKAAALVASTGRDPGNLTAMASSEQARAASSQTVQSKAVDNTREALQQFGPDNKIDPAKSAAAYDAVNKILPGLSNMSEAAREKAMPAAKALADIYGKVADSKQMGLAKVNPFDPRDPNRDSMPNFQGGQLVRAGADGLITPGIGYGDYYVKGKDGKNIPLGQLSEKQLELVNKNIKTGKWN